MNKSNPPAVVGFGAEPGSAPTAKVSQYGYTPSMRLEWASVEAAHNARPGFLYSQAALDDRVAAERELCISAIQALTPKEPNSVWEAAYKAVADDMVAAIRARKP